MSSEDYAAASPFFNLSPSALAEEEENLLDIMLPVEQQATTNDTTAKRKKKKRRKAKQHIEDETAILKNNQISNSNLYWKEGYLLFGHNKQELPLTKRVYAKVRVLKSLYFCAPKQSFPQQRNEASSIWVAVS